MFRTAPGALLLLACLGPAFAGDARPAKAALTLERMLADPPLSGTTPLDLRWLPDGTRYAMLERSGEGKDAAHRLVVVDAASGRSTVVLSEKDLPAAPDDAARAARPRLQGASWSPKGDALLLASGQDLYLYPVPGGPLRRLTRGGAAAESPQFSPDGRFVAFVRAHDLFAIELASGRELRLSADGGENRVNAQFDWLYDEELVGPGTKAYAWSPDGRAIAYITLDETKVPRHPLTDWLPVHPASEQQPYPTPGDPNPVPGLRVVPVLAGGDGPRTLDLAWPDDTKYLVRVGWTPDGTAVTYQLLDRDQARLDFVRLDLATGASTTLVTETDPLWVNLSDQEPVFLRDGRFVWSTERGGSRQLELRDASGRLLHPLTTGAGEVTALLAVDEPSGLVYFASNEGDALERHLWRVKLDGGPAARLTTEPGTHDLRVAPGARFVIDTRSTADRPPSTWLLDRDGRVVRAIDANEKPPILDFALGRTAFVEIKGPSGALLHAALLTPPDFDPAKKYPVIVYVYGGPHVQVVRRAWTGQSAFHHLLAGRGFIVFSLDNRGSFGRGREFERALGRRLGKVELEDQLAGVEWLKSQPYVDAARLGIWGWSYGGTMTLHALTHSDVFKAGAAVAPVTDWRYYDSAYTERYLGTPASNADGYRESSPVSAAEKLGGALLIVHGSTDDNVHWQNTLAFVDRLYKADRPYDLQIYPNKNHGIGGKDARLHLFRRILEHFTRTLFSPS